MTGIVPCPKCKEPTASLTIKEQGMCDECDDRAKANRCPACGRASDTAHHTQDGRTNCPAPVLRLGNPPYRDVYPVELATRTLAGLFGVGRVKDGLREIAPHHTDAEHGRAFRGLMDDLEVE